MQRNVCKIVKKISIVNNVCRKLHIQSYTHSSHAFPGMLVMLVYFWISCNYQQIFVFILPHPFPQIKYVGLSLGHTIYAASILLNLLLPLHTAFLPFLSQAPLPSLSFFPSLLLFLTLLVSSCSAGTRIFQSIPDSSFLTTLSPSIKQIIHSSPTTNLPSTSPENTNHYFWQG